MRIFLFDRVNMNVIGYSYMERSSFEQFSILPELIRSSGGDPVEHGWPTEISFSRLHELLLKKIGVSSFWQHFEKLFPTDLGHGLDAEQVMVLQATFYQGIGHLEWSFLFLRFRNRGADC